MIMTKGNCFLYFENSCQKWSFWPLFSKKKYFSGVLANPILFDRTIKWASTAYKVAKKEKLTKYQLKKFQSLLTLAKSDYEETLKKMMVDMKIESKTKTENRARLLENELMKTSQNYRIKHPLIADIIDRKQIRKLCQEKVSFWNIRSM